MSAGALLGRLGLYVGRAWPLARGLLLEADALTFVQLVESRIAHCTPVEEPLLPAVVADETKTPVPDESLDRSLRHRVSFAVELSNVVVRRCRFPATSISVPDGVRDQPRENHARTPRGLNSPVAGSSVSRRSDAAANSRSDEV